MGSHPSPSRGSLVPRAALIAGAALVLDQAAKSVVRATLSPCIHPPLSACDQVHLASFLTIVWGGNRGGAFGYSQGLWLWTVLAAAAVLMILALPWWGGATRLMGVGAGLLLGGALGNLVDRLRYGAVTDFIGFGNQARVFGINVADLALLVGAVLATWALCRALFKPAAGPGQKQSRPGPKVEPSLELGVVPTKVVDTGEPPVTVRG